MPFWGESQSTWVFTKAALENRTANPDIRMEPFMVGKCEVLQLTLLQLNCRGTLQNVNLVLMKPDRTHCSNESAFLPVSHSHTALLQQWLLEEWTAFSIALEKSQSSLKKLGPNPCSKTAQVNMKTLLPIPSCWIKLISNDLTEQWSFMPRAVHIRIHIGMDIASIDLIKLPFNK